MKIYKNEEHISDLVKANKISYAAQLSKISNDQFATFKPKVNKELLTKAGITDKDLYYLTAILVTSCVNKNDDCFLPEVIWAARKTPIDKSTNLDHVPSQIVGHIHDAWPIDAEGNLMEDKDEIELPSKFHILVGSVIYKLPEADENYLTAVSKLLEDIDSGNKFISMEAQFANFDYGLSKGEEFKVIGRHENTSFLTKYLRSYGGDGKYQDYTISRVLRDVNFIAFGFVDKPANPESIIMTNDDILDFAKAKFLNEIDEKIDNSETSGVLLFNKSISTENISMSDFYVEQNKELKVKNESLEKMVAELKDQFAQSNVAKLEKEIANLQAQTKDLGGDLVSKSEALTAKEVEEKKLQAKVDELTKSNEELNKSNTELSEKVNKIEAEKKVQSRVSTLVEGGLTKEDAIKEVEVFASLDDVQFEAIAKRIAEAAKMFVKEDDDKKKKDEKKKAEATADEKSVENAEVTSEEITSASDESDIEDEVMVSLVKNLTAALKTSDKEKNGDK